MSKILGIVVGGGVIFYGYRKIVDKSKRLRDDQHVVIIGGGYGGIRVAKELKGRGKFTLIDARDKMHHNMASLRAAIEPGFAPKMLIPFRESLGDHFVQGKVVDIDVKNKQVCLDGDQTPIPYTELVVATGSGGTFPGKTSIDSSSSKVMQEYENFVAQVQKAKKIVIVGGGPVGVELAGEIATDYPGQKGITLVHNTEILVSPELLPKARHIVEEKFAKKNINVILGEVVTNLNELPVNKASEGLKVKLSSGKELEADLVVKCFGMTINNEAYKNSLGEFMNERGQLRVKDTLEVEGLDSVFAVGDCNNFDVTKLASNAQVQGSCTYNNLINIAKNKPLQPYKPGMFQMCVPIGRDGGFSQAGSWVLGDFMTRKIKSTDVFISIMWKEFGLEPPK